MKLSTTFLLLVAGSFCLFQGCTAGVSVIQPSQSDLPAAVVESEYREEDIDLMPPVIGTVDDAEDVKVEHLDIQPPQVVAQAAVASESEYTQEDIDLIPPETGSTDEDVKPASSADVPQGRSSGCTVVARGELPTSYEPIYLESDSEEIYPYDSTGAMVFNTGKTMDLWCPGQFSTIASTLITATCVSGTNFRVDGTTYTLKELTCNSYPAFTAEKTGATCNGGVEIRVGYKVSTTRFAKKYTVCFNEEDEVTRYVHHNLEPGNNYYQTGVSRITFQTAGFFDGKSVNNLYTQATQLATIDAVLGGTASQYFDSSKNIYLARGHMGAKADFVYASGQRSSFLFINAAPQWQVFNAGNWERIEDGVRTKVSTAGWDVDCYTGVYGVTTLPNQDGVQTPLYLAYDSNNNGLIPVPKLYFRVVIERSTKKGIVFIGVNNPHLSLEEIEEDYIICTDISDQVDYISWKRTDLTAGYSYACEVSDFRNKVTNLPELSATGGLLL